VHRPGGDSRADDRAAASGIGAEVARALAARGAHLLLADIDRTGVTETARRISLAGGVAEPFVCDVRDPAAVAELAVRAQARFAPLDFVCPAAGVAFPEAPLDESALEAINALLDVNLRGVIYTLRALLPHVRHGSSVVLVASTSGICAYPGGAVYAASKIALIGLTRSLALEVAPRRVRVNAVCPGPVDTPLQRSIFGAAVDGILADSARFNPLGRVAVPSDIADAVAFLASDAVRHITGVALFVDGGQFLGEAPSSSTSVRPSE